MLKTDSASGPSTAFFHKMFRTLFHNVAGDFSHALSRLVSQIFSYYLSFLFFRTAFLAELFAHPFYNIFLTRLFRVVCCPKGFHNLQPQHCIRYLYLSIKPITLDPILAQISHLKGTFLERQAPKFHSAETPQ